MLEKPCAGWTTVIIGDICLGSASYLDDVPVMCLEAFISYLSKDNKNFNLEFDAEEYHFTITKILEHLYCFDTKTNSSSLNVKELKPESLNLNEYSCADDMLIEMAKKLVNDIEKYYDDWLYWNCDDSPSEDEIKKRMNLLKTYINTLKKILL